MKIYDGPDGAKLVDSGERSVLGGPYMPGVYFADDPSEYIAITTASSHWIHGGFTILRLATPEEIAGTEKKMCPAGCGADYGAHASHQGCPWFKALLKKSDLDSTADFPLCSAYADAHWREFLPKPGVLLTPESVGKAYCVRGAYNHVGQAYWVKEDGKLADRCEAWAATFHNVKDKDLDLISEWDEKAEAGATPEGAATPNACTAKKAASAPPAQPEILPTWTDGDVRAELAARTGVVHVDAAENRRRLVAVMAEDAKPREVYVPDAPDRRAEHVPVAKAWVNPAMLGR